MDRLEEVKKILEDHGVFRTYGRDRQVAIEETAELICQLFGPKPDDIDKTLLSSNVLSVIQTNSGKYKRRI